MSSHEKEHNKKLVRKRMAKAASSIYVLALTAALAGCSAIPKEKEQTPSIQATASVHPELKAHSYEFERKVYEVTDGVHVAVGYGLANSIMIEGDDGIIIVDVMESKEAAEKVMAEFRKITDKPVKALMHRENPRPMDVVMNGWLRLP
ncbi:hypothetical protein GZ78_05870 [Endozoicomonas numazuensis]|uniref:Metallo-beta-lactamase domain-containing protein n=2 Tax=Endozoicomonas numazuensis TaxID=1137799 RepID=A0A081NLZ0_9GAMM|nr:hypothetical protein GZ78_05870 [Endozoicomonas numazuensis]